MQSPVCRACRKPLGINKGKNIFDENSVIKSFDIDGNYDDKWIMKILFGLGIITGEVPTRGDKLPRKLCDPCFHKVESFINFRCHLLQSKEHFLCKYRKISVGIASSSTENLQSTHNVELRINVNNSILKQKQIKSFQSNTVSNSIVSSNSKTPKCSLSKALSDELINVDEDSMSHEANKYQCETKESCYSASTRLKNDQKNNNVNETVNSIQTLVSSSKEAIKLPEQNRESEIDVCSGEDDEVLELDVPKKKNEIVEIVSSSDSDIDVGDSYEPPLKKSSLSPLIKFN